MENLILLFSFLIIAIFGLVLALIFKNSLLNTVDFLTKYSMLEEQMKEGVGGSNN